MWIDDRNELERDDAGSGMCVAEKLVRSRLREPELFQVLKVPLLVS